MKRSRAIAASFLVLMLVALAALWAQGPPEALVSEPPLDFITRVVGVLAGAPDQALDELPLPLILAIHGLGDKPERFMRLFHGLPFPARVVAVRAPDPYRKGSSWYPFAHDADVSPARDVRVRENAARLARLLAHLVTHYPTRGRPVVTGFSQGGVMSMALALLHPASVAAAIPLSGVLPTSLMPASVAPGSRYPPLRAHIGDQDPYFSVQRFRAAMAHLRTIGLDADLSLYPGLDHNVSPDMRAELYRLLEMHCAPRVPAAPPTRPISLF
jgi:phospholipase/carboxylesterase